MKMPLGFNFFICKRKLRCDICETPSSTGARKLQPSWWGFREDFLKISWRFQRSLKSQDRAGDWVGSVAKTQSAGSLQPATPQRLSLGTLKQHLKKKNHSYALKSDQTLWFSSPPLIWTKIWVFAERKGESINFPFRSKAEFLGGLVL